MRSKELSDYQFKLSENASVGLDLIRAFCAQWLVVVHGAIVLNVAPWFMPPNFPLWPVLIFTILFLLSGMFITYSTSRKLQRRKYTFKVYFIERFSRIYSAYIPALLIIVGFDAFLIIVLNTTTYINSYNLGTFIGNLFILQESYPLFSPIFGHTYFGSALQLWTLPIEWWLYMLIGWLILGRRSTKSKVLYFITLVIFFLLFFSILTGGTSTYNNYRLTMASIPWILGCVMAIILNIDFKKESGILKRSIQEKRTTKIKSHFMKTMDWATSRNRSLLFMMLFILLLIIRGFLVIDIHDPLVSLCMMGAIYFLIMHLNQTKFKIPDSIKKSIRLFANYSFTLYLLHYSIIVILATQASIVPPLFLIFLGFILSNIISLIVALVTEMQHKKLRNFLLKISGKENWAVNESKVEF